MVERDILNIDEAAELLGVSVKTFNKVLHSEDLPARKIGREWKFSRQALIDWVGSGQSRRFYKEGGHEDERDERDEIVPAQRGSASGDNGNVARPRARRTAGWAIEE
jgi:excisionase family DNA binding protein